LYASQLSNPPTRILAVEGRAVGAFRYFAGWPIGIGFYLFPIATGFFSKGLKARRWRAPTHQSEKHE
jgi:hypothetical protein